MILILVFISYFGLMMLDIILRRDWFLYSIRSVLIDIYYLSKWPIFLLQQDNSQSQIRRSPLCTSNPNQSPSMANAASQENYYEYWDNDQKGEPCSSSPNLRRGCLARDELTGRFYFFLNYDKLWVYLIPLFKIYFHQKTIIQKIKNTEDQTCFLCFHNEKQFSKNCNKTYLIFLLITG